MEASSVRSQRNAAGWRSKRGRVQSARREHPGHDLSLAAAGIDVDHLNGAASAAAPSTGRPLELLATPDSGHRDKFAAHQLTPNREDDSFGGAGTRLASPAAVTVSVASTLIDPCRSSANGVRDTDADASSTARRGRLFIFTRPSSASATLAGMTNILSVPHPALRSRSLLAAQQQRLQSPSPLPSHELGEQSIFSHDGPSPTAPQPGCVAPLPSDNRLELSAMGPATTPCIETAAQIRPLSSKALNARPRPASFTYTPSSDSQLVERNHDLTQGRGSGSDCSPTAPARQASTPSKNAARDAVPPSPSRRSLSSSVPWPHRLPVAERLKGAALGDAGVNITHHIRSRSGTVVRPQRSRQDFTDFSLEARPTHARGTGGDAAGSGANSCESSEPDAAAKNAESDSLCEDDPAHDELILTIPFTPQAAAGAAGVEIGPASGDWNLPRVQQRILAARLQAEVHQHFTSAVEILLSVQMSLDADYHEASRGGEPASDFVLNPAQRAYYADLVGRELQYVAALWVRKLQINNPPVHTLTMPAMNRFQAASGGIALCYAALPGTATEAGERGEHCLAHCTSTNGNNYKQHQTVSHTVASTNRRFSSSTHSKNSATVSESQPNTPCAPARSVAEVCVTCSDPQSRKHLARRRIRAVFHEIPLVQACMSHLPHSHDSAVDDHNNDTSGEGQMSRSLDGANNVKPCTSFPHTSVSSESGTSATSLCLSAQSFCVLNGPTQCTEYCEHCPLFCPKRTRYPISRTRFMMEAINSESSIIKELSSGWDDDVLSSQPHAPFERAMSNVTQRRSAQMKKKNRDLYPTLSNRRSRSSCGFLQKAAVGESNVSSPIYKSSPLADTPMECDSVLSASIHNPSLHLRQCSLPLPPTSLAERHAARSAGGDAATAEPMTALKAPRGSEDAASAMSAHVRRSSPLSSTSSSAAVVSSSLCTPEKHRLVSSAGARDSAAIAVAREHGVSEEIFHSLPPPAESITADCHVGDSAAAAVHLRAATTAGEPALGPQSADTGGTVSVLGIRVSMDRTSPEMGTDGLDELNTSYASSSGNSRRVARQRQAFAGTQRGLSEAHSATGTSCDLHLSADSNMCSTPDSVCDLGSGNDYCSETYGITYAITATSATQNDSTTGSASASSTHTATSDVAEEEEAVRALLVHTLDHVQPGAASTSSPGAPNYPFSKQHSPDAAPLRSTLPFAESSASVMQSSAACVCEQATCTDRCLEGCEGRRSEMQQLLEVDSDESPNRQDTRRFLSPPSSASLLSTRREDDRRHPSPSCIHIPYAYHYTTIVGADGQPYKRLILCRTGSAPVSTRSGRKASRPAVLTNSADVRAGDPLTTQPADSVPSLPPSYPMRTTPALASPTTEEEKPAVCLLPDQHSEELAFDEALGVLKSRHESGHRLLEGPLEQHLPREASKSSLGSASRSQPGACKPDTGQAAATIADGDGKAGSKSEVFESSDTGSQERGERATRSGFIFSSDVAQQWLEEEGFAAGSYQNPYRVQMDRAMASSLKWRGPAVRNLRGYGAVGGGDVEPLPRGSYTWRLVTVPAVSSAPGLSRGSTAGALGASEGRRCDGPAYGSFAGACVRPTGVYSTQDGGRLKRCLRQGEDAPASPLEVSQKGGSNIPMRCPAVTGAGDIGAGAKDRCETGGVDIPKQLWFLRYGVMEADVLRGERGAHAHSAHVRPSLPSESAMQLQRRQLYSDGCPSVYQGCAAGGATPVVFAADGARVTPWKRPETMDALRPSRW